MNDPGSGRRRVGARPNGPSRITSGRIALGRALVALVLVGAAALAHAQPASVHARLGASTISIDESVTLVVEASGLDGELDTSALERDFEIIGRSSSRDVSILNGERRSAVTWVLELVPREIGVFTVPPVTVGGVESELLSLTVTEAPTGGERSVFVEAEVDTDTPWVQSQVILTVRVLRAIDIVDGALGEPVGEGLDVRTLGEDRRYTERRDGRDYVVVERRFALFPQRSGPLSIEPITLSVTVPSDPSRISGFFSPTRKLTRRTRAIALAVRARPAGVGGWWLPAADVTLEESWAGTGSGATPGAAFEARVGEPLTRTVSLEASGVLSTQLPDVEVPEVEGLSVYADDPARVDAADENGVRATQTLAFAVIPAREGTYELPPISVDWFDVERGEAATAVLPGRSVTVLPGAAGTAPPAVADPMADASDPDDDAVTVTSAAASVGEESGAGEDVAATRWRTIALGALIGWAVSTAAVAFAWRSRRAGGRPDTGGPNAGSDDETVSARTARRRLREAAHDEDVAAFARAVLALAAAHWPEAPPRSLASLARRIDASAGLDTPLAALDAVVYGPPRREADGVGRGGRAGRVAPPDAAAMAALAERLERALAATSSQGAARRTARTAAREGALPPL